LRWASTAGAWSEGHPPVFIVERATVPVRSGVGSAQSAVVASSSAAALLLLGAVFLLQKIKLGDVPSTGVKDRRQLAVPNMANTSLPTALGDWDDFSTDQPGSPYGTDLRSVSPDLWERDGDRGSLPSVSGHRSPTSALEPVDFLSEPSGPWEYGDAQPLRPWEYGDALTESDGSSFASKEQRRKGRGGDKGGRSNCRGWGRSSKGGKKSRRMFSGLRRKASIESEDSWPEKFMAGEDISIGTRSERSLRYA